MSKPHAFRFHRIGGLDQVALDTDADLRALPQLDPKLWVALACPASGLEIDERTLALLDTDGDKRIRVPEVLAAVDWTGRRLKNLAEILAGSSDLPLAAIDDATPEGQQALASARRILASLGHGDATTLSLADAADTVGLFKATTLNGDGVVVAASTADPALQALIGEVIACVDGVADRSGEAGVDAGRVEAFFTAAAAHLEWLRAGDAIALSGVDLPAAQAAVDAVRARVEDWFARAQLAAFDARAAAALDRSEAAFTAIADRELGATMPEIAALPLAAVAADGRLPLRAGVNPAWAAALDALRATALEPVLGRPVDELVAADWQQVLGALAGYAAWQASCAGGEVAALGRERLEAIAASDARAQLLGLIAADAALQPEFDAIHDVEKLIRLRRDLGVLLRNFVNFADFYAPEGHATFQAGTLFLDSRSTDLCIRVAGPNPLAAMSKVYIAYCDCTRPGAAPMKIAGCFTQGDSDYLFVGRNGVFWDRAGRDWDAQVTAIVENPISIPQAFWLPYKKLLRWIEETVAKRAAAAEAESDQKVASMATATANVDALKPADPKAPPAPPKRVDVGTVAALGVAITGAISALTLVLGYVFGMAAWEYPLALGGVVLAISGPSMVIAWLKLRQRNLGPILEGCGWAINGRVAINVPLGARLTARAVLPKGAVRSLDDPYRDVAARRRTRLFWVACIVALVAATWVHARYFNDGRYFWQAAPVAADAAAPAAEPAAPPA